MSLIASCASSKIGSVEPAADSRGAFLGLPARSYRVEWTRARIASINRRGRFRPFGLEPVKHARGAMTKLLVAISQATMIGHEGVDVAELVSDSRAHLTKKR